MRIVRKRITLGDRFRNHCIVKPAIVLPLLLSLVTIKGAWAAPPDINLYAIRFKDPSRRVGDPTIDRASESEVKSYLAKAASSLVAELESLDVRDRRYQNLLDNLSLIGEAGSEVVPRFIALLHSRDTDPTFRIPYFCQAAKTLTEIAPQSPLVIRAIAESLTLYSESGKEKDSIACGCALVSLTKSGKAAAEIAGPALETYIAKNQAPPFEWQLSNALEAIQPKGVENALIQRIGKSSVHPRESILLIRDLTKAFGSLKEIDRQKLYPILVHLASDRYSALSAASLDILGLFQIQALPELTKYLADRRYEVRDGAIRGLLRLGPTAKPARLELIQALDPFLGTVKSAALALVAIGGQETASLVRAHGTSVAEVFRPFLEDVAVAIETKKPELIKKSLEKHFTRTNLTNGFLGSSTQQGYVRLEVLELGKGKPYDPVIHRARMNFRASLYKTDQDKELIQSGKGVSEASSFINSNSFLTGLKKGARAILTLSADASDQVPFSVKVHPSLSNKLEKEPVVYELEITEVCEPYIWQLFRGSGIIGPMEFELWCF